MTPVSPARQDPLRISLAFVALGCLSGIVNSLERLAAKGAPNVWEDLLLGGLFYLGIGALVYRYRFLTAPRTLLFVATMIVSGLIFAWIDRTVFSQLIAQHLRPQDLARIGSRATWLFDGLSALIMLAFFRGRTLIALTAILIPGSLATNIFSFMIAAPQIAGLPMPSIYLMAAISTAINQIIRAFALSVFVTNGGRPVEPVFLATTLKRPPDLHWLLVVVLSLFTGGAFLGLWAIVQASWARSVERSTSAMPASLLGTLLVVLTSALVAAAPFYISDDNRDAVVLTGFALALGGSIAYWIGVFAEARAIELYARTMHSRDLHLDRILVFLATVFYLQFHLSRLAACDRENDRTNAIAA